MIHSVYRDEEFCAGFANCRVEIFLSRIFINLNISGNETVFNVQLDFTANHKRSIKSQTPDDDNNNT